MLAFIFSPFCDTEPAVWRDELKRTQPANTHDGMRPNPIHVRGAFVSSADSEQDPLLSPSERLTWRRLQLQEQKTMKWCSLLSADSGWVAVKERVGRWQEGRTRRREKKECERVNKEAAEEGNRFKQCDKRDKKWEWKATDTCACMWPSEEIELFHVSTSVSGINDFRGLSSVLSLDRIKAFAFSLWLSVNGAKTCQFRSSQASRVQRSIAIMAGVPQKLDGRQDTEKFFRRPCVVWALNMILVTWCNKSRWIYCIIQKYLCAHAVKNLIQKYWWAETPSSTQDWCPQFSTWPNINYGHNLAQLNLLWWLKIIMIT